jgi:Flp pilus assembly pilin Flp
LPNVQQTAAAGFFGARLSKQIRPGETMTQFRILQALWGAIAGADLRREEGQTLAEYALILALIAVGVIAAVIFLQGSISSIFNNVGSSI